MMTTSALAVTAELFTEQSNSASSARSEPRLLTQAESVLALGSTGSAVKELQAMLALMGYYSGSVDGIYEQGTMAAVRQFQTDAKLTADGVVGPATWRRLLPTPAILAEPQTPSVSEGNGAPGDTDTPDIDSPINTAASESAGDLPVLQLDDRGADVTTLQQRLAALNLYSGLIDGVFGSQTEQAVEAFQRQSGLGVDGVVGPATWQQLLR
ncbi:MAG: peptidoglycan-binding protein [Cyanobacteria bacterium P01_A01_bin.137]